MSDFKVVEMKKENMYAFDNAEVIRFLEDALEHAREGKIHSLAMLTIDSEGNVMDCWHNADSPYVMLGAMEALRFDFLNSSIELR
ncbi:TPA: hypothetical protein RMT52_005057 [Escherichia coli]|nr:hypothetical protein [Escherichia coli]HAX1982829.1 hypothetical protein [Escherichia coli]HAX2345283.1 hypothetical protein [Escherichia coli]HBN7237025.1 hypothetical protein [Escherichia coli]HBN7443560.1 hypothetical protein [Escherichia coli]